MRRHLEDAHGYTDDQSEYVRREQIASVSSLWDPPKYSLGDLPKYSLGDPPKYRRTCKLTQFCAEHEGTRHMSHSGVDEKMSTKKPDDQEIS